MIRALLAIVLVVGIATAQLPGACGHAQLPVGFLGYGVNPVLLDSAEAYTVPIVDVTYNSPNNVWSYIENGTLACYPDQAEMPMDLDANLADMTLSMVDKYTWYSKNVSDSLNLGVNFNVPNSNISVGGQFGYLHKKYNVMSKDSMNFFSQFIRYVQYYMVGLSYDAKPSMDLMYTLENLPVPSSPEDCANSAECAIPYCNVLTSYGTLYVSRVVMGGSINMTASVDKTFTYKYGASETDLEASLTIKYLGQTVGMLSGSYNTTWSKISNEFKEAMNNFTGIIGGDQAAYASGGYGAWMQSLPKEPEMIVWKSQLTPIYHLIPVTSSDNTMRYETLRAISLQYFNSGGVAPCNIGARSA